MAVLKDRITATTEAWWPAVGVGLLMAAVIGMPVWVPLLPVRAQPPPPGQSIVATTQVGILVGGLPIAAEPNINFASGNGIIETAKDNPAMSRVDVQPGFNTALVPTHDVIHANENFCDSTNGTWFYTCASPNKVITSYNRGMVWLLAVDTTCQLGCSVNIDMVGPKNLYLSDGVTAANGTPVAGRAVWIWFDGTIFRLL